MVLDMSPSEFWDKDKEFKERICDMFEPNCRTKYMRDIEVVGTDPPSRQLRFLQEASQSSVSFTIKFKAGGPTVPHMRGRLNSKELVQEALGDEFTLVLPYQQTVTELTDHISWYRMEFDLNLIKATIIINIMFALLGLWGLVVFWTITARGDACRKRAHSEWRAALIPSAETLQVFVLSCFLQLVLSLSLHIAFVKEGSFTLVVIFGLGIGGVGAIFFAVLNSWIRGESISLRKALDVRRVDKTQSEWYDEREYGVVYEPGGDRMLGQLARHDWESHHLSMEQRMGLVDMSDNCFDEVKAEKDPSLLAAFLNTSLMGAVTGKKDLFSEQNKPPPVNTDLQVVKVEVTDVHAARLKTMVRDAMLQWRMRHAAHATELDAVNWLLGQLDPSFELLAVKVPEQARMLIVEALIQYSQRHPELEFDASHTARVQSTLQQLSTRFQGMKVELPDDGENTVKVRELLEAALKARIEKPTQKNKEGIEKPSRDITQEEGMLLQQALGVIGDATPLVAMPHKNGADDEAMLEAIKKEVEGRADEMRSGAEAAGEYLYDEDIYAKVPMILRTKPPDAIEELADAASPNISPRMPPQAPEGEEANAEEAAGQQTRKRPSLLRLWWRGVRRQDKKNHDQAPCWRQYFVLFLGSLAVGMLTVASTTLFAFVTPLTQYFVVFSFGISVPTSMIIHIIMRTLLRVLRRRRALQRGRMVEGMWATTMTKEERRAARNALRKKGGARASQSDQGGRRWSATADPDVDLETGPVKPTLASRSSAYLGNALLDAAPSLATRMAEREEERQLMALGGAKVAGVMQRSRHAEAAPSAPAVSDFLSRAPSFAENPDFDKPKGASGRSKSKRLVARTKKEKKPDAKQLQKEREAAHDAAMARAEAMQRTRCSFAGPDSQAALDLGDLTEREPTVAGATAPETMQMV